MNLKSSQRLVVFVLFFKFHGTLSATQCFVRENEMMPRNIKDSKSIVRTIQCSSWASSCRTETCFSIVSLLHRKQKQVCETLTNVCAYWATALVWCIFLYCLHFILPQFFAQNPQKPEHTQQFHLCPSGSSCHHLIQDPTLYTSIQIKLWTVELKLKKLRNYSDHNSVE